MRLPTALVALVLACSHTAGAKQPNIIILFADDLGYGELSCQNSKTDVPTPHIDSIAKNGIRFTQAYVTAPNCSPSRAGLLTGRIPIRFGYENNPTGWKNEQPEFGLPLADRKSTRLNSSHKPSSYAVFCLKKKNTNKKKKKTTHLIS